MKWWPKTGSKSIVWTLGKIHKKKECYLSHTRKLWLADILRKLWLASQFIHLLLRKQIFSSTQPSTFHAILIHWQTWRVLVISPLIYVLASCTRLCDYHNAALRLPHCLTDGYRETDFHMYKLFLRDHVFGLISLDRMYVRNCEGNSARSSWTTEISPPANQQLTELFRKMWKGISKLVQLTMQVSERNKLDYVAWSNTARWALQSASFVRVQNLHVLQWLVTSYIVYSFITQNRNAQNNQFPNRVFYIPPFLWSRPLQLQQWGLRVEDQMLSQSRLSFLGDLSQLRPTNTSQLLDINLSYSCKFKENTG